MNGLKKQIHASKNVPQITIEIREVSGAEK
jgi:hypothetical protein